ncbi:MAG: exodeoxyribonuclease VII small subunit [Pseudomonadales bacterium]|jgi:exodeoxyribonuclease VII small subunit|nr:exodeoxyribonuclease VII small subunit [Pseudomonadales bacterium]
MTEDATDGAGVDFEAALAELEGLVERMERGELSLDDSLGAFERGIHLTRTCQRALADAEQRVRLLLEREDGDLELREAADASGEAGEAAS